MLLKNQNFTKNQTFIEFYKFLLKIRISVKNGILIKTIKIAENIVDTKKGSSYNNLYVIESLELSCWVNNLYDSYEIRNGFNGSSTAIIITKKNETTNAIIPYQIITLLDLSARKPET